MADAHFIRASDMFGQNEVTNQIWDIDSLGSYDELLEISRSVFSVISRSDTRPVIFRPAFQVVAGRRIEFLYGMYVSMYMYGYVCKYVYGCVRACM